ncbi:ATP-binding protein [Cylindrospermopsis curvispora]|uniref:ATP-binding protein n=1 Tax=Cylindrospermopsis curvispora TaxID=747548 RepID=UPI001CA6BBF4|nr:ATP-binding protein [Cylindrospermopsis curvispora]
MSKHFNTAGPCKADIHYMLPPTARLPELRSLINQQNYFVIHAPRQVSKTTAMLALAQELTASGEYTAVMLSLEVGAPFSSDLDSAEQAILSEWKQSIRFRLPPNLQPTYWPGMETRSKLNVFLSAWAATSERPLVVFLDEIDALSDQSLIGVLRQLRSGYPNRPQGFPYSLGLIGMRDVRDYKVKAGGIKLLRSEDTEISEESINELSEAGLNSLY